MSSPTHTLFLEAMRKRRQIHCTYQGHRRELCPILLGRTGLEEKALVFQSGGETSSGTVATSGEWKCLRLAGVKNAVLVEGVWRVGDDHSAAQTCMKMVEYDVNPESPYFLAFRL